MIRPSQSWCLQIEITNACHMACSNCTRLVPHVKTPFFISLEDFEKAAAAAASFITEGERDLQGRGKLVSIMGGEPLLHPQFPEIVNILCKYVPRPQNRGIFTSKDWKTQSHPKYGPFRPHVEKLVGPHEKEGREGGGWLGWNMHLESMKVHHQPVLTASEDLVKDEKRRWELIENCWLQRSWSPSMTPKGFFFCEIAGAMSIVMDGPDGIPIEEGCWQGDLDFVTDERGIRQPTGKFAEQIKEWCVKCGVCVPYPGRRDNDEIDDISPSNLIRLEDISPRVKKGRTFLVEDENTQGKWNPRKYIKGSIPQNQSRVAKAEQDLRKKTGDPTITEVEMKWLAKMARGCEVILEIGTHAGGSTKLLAEASHGLVITIDPYRRPFQHVKQKFEHNAKDLIAQGRIVQIAKGSEMAVGDLEKILAARGINMRSVDMLFIDGDHSYEGVTRDIVLYSPFVRPGGLICGHDYNSRFLGLQKAVNELVQDRNIDETIWWTQ